MKKVFVLLLLIAPIAGMSQAYQYWAKRLLANDSIRLVDRWINKVSTNLNSPDSNSHHMIATNRAIMDAIRQFGGIGSIFASNGIYNDADTLKLGDTLTQLTTINLNGNDIRFTGTGNFVVGNTGSSTAKLQVNTGSFTPGPYLQVGPLLSNNIYANIHTSDTVTASNVSSFPIRGLQMNRNIVMQQDNLTVTDHGGAFLGQVFRIRDSVRLNPQGSDLMYGVRSSINFAKYAGYSGRSIVQSGLFDFDVTQAQLGMIATSGSGANYFRLRGYYASFTGYLITNPVDTIDNFISFHSTSNNTGRALKSYNFYGGSIQNSDTAFGIYIEGGALENKYNYLQHRTGIGVRLAQELIHIAGNARIDDTLKMPNIIQQTDTTTYKPAVADATGNLFKLDRWPIGGGIASVNSQTGPAITLTTGTAGSDFAASTTSNTVTFNLPAASTTASGKVNISAQTFAGVKTFNDGLVATSSLTNARLRVTGNYNFPSQPGVSGTGAIYNAFTYNDAGASRTEIDNQTFHYIGIPTVTADNAVTYTDIATLKIIGAPVAGTNMTITRPRSLYAQDIAHTDITAHNVVENSSGTLTMGANGLYIATGTTATYDLPNLATFQGAVYYVKNAGSGNLTIQRSGSDNLYDTSSVTSIVIPAGGNRLIVAGIAFWYVFSM